MPRIIILNAAFAGKNSGQRLNANPSPNVDRSFFWWRIHFLTFPLHWLNLWLTFACYSGKKHVGVDVVSNYEIAYSHRICDSETMANKLIYQIRKEQLTPIDLQKLQNRCNRELQELRQELDELLQELRVIADTGQTSVSSARIAAWLFHFFSSPLPSIQQSFHASLSDMEWFMNAYTLAFAVLLIPFP